MTRVIYSANFGGSQGRYDDMPISAPQKTRMVCFTDDPELTSTQWEIVLEEPRYENNPRMSAKWYKCMLDCVEADESVWVDAQSTLKEGFDEWVFGCLDRDFVTWNHPERQSLWPEADAAFPLKKYAGQPIYEQMGHYKAEGYEGHGMQWTACIARRHTGEMRALGHAWLWECERWCHHDQLSLPVVAARLGIEIGYFPGNGLSCPYWQTGGHLRDD